MDDESKTPQELHFEALDLMVQAGWISEYARDATNTAIQWTEYGKTAIATIWSAIDELGPERMNHGLWWAIGTVAMIHFRPGGPGFAELGISE